MPLPSAYDEMELDTLGEKKTALFVIISDTDATFNFIVKELLAKLAEYKPLAKIEEIMTKSAVFFSPSVSSSSSS